MRHIGWVVALALAGCGEPMLDADGGPSDGAAPADAWTPPMAVLRCVATDVDPQIGEHAFCPAVHDHVARQLELAWDAGEVCADAGDGGVCGPAERGWRVVDSCARWVDCTLSAGRQCYHCPAWSDDPLSAP